MSRLSQLGKAARLASVGDRVDFVVTLGRGPEQSSGRLERQTRSGTVAIREYRDARCEAVAEALALTLELALEPEAAPALGAPAGVAHAGSSDGATASSDEDVGLGTVPATRAAAEPSVGEALKASAADDGAHASRHSISIGAQATLTTGVAPAALPGAALFVSGHTGSPWLSTWRGALFGGYRASSAELREIEVLLAGARVEGCSFEARFGAVAVAPCLGLDAGLLHASGPAALGTTDSGFWSAVAAHGRLVAALADSLSLELQVGGLAPLVRYEMGTRDGSVEWFRTRAVGLDARLGMAWQIP
ncbi:MAG TPA: hypothetical protein VMG12_08855 [Polyangiaceae bacterium]|nr:hypothetical protein [Polyangiaceae bacterium]